MGSNIAMSDRMGSQRTVGSVESAAGLAAVLVALFLGMTLLVSVQVAQSFETEITRFLGIGCKLSASVNLHASALVAIVLSLRSMGFDVHLQIFFGSCHFSAHWTSVLFASLRWGRIDAGTGEVGVYLHFSVVLVKQDPLGMSS